MSWAPTLVGRGAELAELEHECRRAMAGEFRCVALVADPGVGKTRLASELLARRRRTITLAARAHPLGGTTPFGLWAEALEGHLRGVPGDEVVKLCGGFLDDLAVLLRSAAAVRGSAPAGPASRPRLLEGLAVLVGNLARSTPAVVFLDDVHLADASSWEGLHYLARNIPDAPVLVIAAARGAELADAHIPGQILFGLEQDGLLHRLDLLPLEREAIRELAEAVLQGPAPPRLAAWLAERSQGNPLFAIGLLQALRDQGADLSQPTLARLPNGLAGRVGQRLACLDEPALATLDVLAVLGRRVELAELVELSGRSLERLGTILETLVRARLVLETERGREVTYEIAHPLVQETIYQTIGAARRRVLHRLMARALVEAGRLGAAAPHYARAAEIGDPEAVEVLRQAVRDAEYQGAYREALELLGLLVELLPPDDERWRDVADCLSWNAEWVVDHRADAHGELGITAMRAIDRALASLCDPGRRAQVKLRLAGFLTWGSGELAEAERRSVEALSLFKGTDDRTGTMLAANQLAYIRWIAGDYPDFELASQRLLDAAEAAGDRFVALQALNALGMGAYFRGGFAKAEHALRRSADIARQDGRLYRLTMSLGVMGLSLALQGRLEDARPLLEEAKASNPDWRDTVLPEWELVVPWLAGNFGDAVAGAEDVLARNPLGLGRRRAVPLVFAALSAAETGQVALARRYLDQVRSTYEGRRWFYWSDYDGYGEAVLAWREGKPREAIRALRETADAVRELKSFLSFVLVDLSEVAAGCQEAAVADEAAGELAEVARVVDGDLCLALSALAGAWSSLAGGDPKTASERARKAVDVLADTGCRAFAARALDVLGRSLCHLDRPGAVGALRDAVVLFDACGAAWRRELVLAALRDLGAAGRRAASAASGPASLTRRERDVARLAARGHTARQIADQLVISRRTAEGYLASAYAKLGIESKLELVRRAAEFEL